MENRAITISQSDALTFLFYRTNYVSYFPIAYRTKTDFNGYAGYLCSNSDSDSFDEYFDEMQPNRDLYICPNGMKTRFKRKSENLINIQNLVIDIDSHDSSISIEELNKRINEIENTIIDKLIVKPNLINKTGRGIHLWFCIEPCHVSLKCFCDCAIDLICGNVSNILSELKEEHLEVDKASSMKLNGLFRVPYSYNTKANKWSEARLIHEEEPNINDILTAYKEHGYKSKYARPKIKAKIPPKQPKQKRFHYIDSLEKNEYKPCLIHRKKFMDYLFRTRNVDVGSRDIMLFAMYATVLQLYGKGEAREYCEEINDNLANPLSYGELLSIFNEVETKNHKFSVKKFFTFVNATETEKKWFNSATIKEERRKEKRKQKEEKYNRIKELHNAGVSITNLSREFGISRPTIYKIIS